MLFVVLASYGLSTFSKTQRAPPVMKTYGLCNQELLNFVKRSSLPYYLRMQAVAAVAILMCVYHTSTSITGRTVDGTKSCMTLSIL